MTKRIYSAGLFIMALYFMGACLNPGGDFHPAWRGLLIAAIYCGGLFAVLGAMGDAEALKIVTEYRGQRHLMAFGPAFRIVIMAIGLSGFALFIFTDWAALTMLLKGTLLWASISLILILGVRAFKHYSGNNPAE